MQWKSVANKQMPLFGVGHTDYCISSFFLVVTKFLDQKQLKEESLCLADGSKRIESSWWEDMAWQLEQEQESDYNPQSQAPVTCFLQKGSPS